MDEKRIAELADEIELAVLEIVNSDIGHDAALLKARRLAERFSYEMAVDLARKRLNCEAEFLLEHEKPKPKKGGKG